ncbi:thiamine pyrophosphate protein domain protein TPP-binding [Desulfatibacillum aliphaticivorans]|uniref:Thiamine pyrophosphate protein domain protein TPP-binding n=1 Tax=Desulfatibacillum aliphaticivorans TaxID=218208 RepID=B8FBZ8_DESAL|nr:thiamine pyrophosphate-binding protein [Desulfatibacillum aliphaticivorans]ACL05203.1 thiamine pyrophosphate protein domain protein TPP-binding [Desulfatibacillum aliphaticivorans]
MESQSRNVSELMVDTLINWGVHHIFGMVGHSNLGLAEAIRQRCLTGDLQFIGIRHEGAAAFAASAYAKLSGRPAACLSIAGPGATNLLTGLWDAHMDRVPVIALTGQVNSNMLGRNSFQEVDLHKAFAGAACFSQTVYKSSDHAELMNLAMKSALENRDVAHLVFPNDVQELEVDENAAPGSPVGRIARRKISPAKKDVDQAAELFLRAERPVIIMGHGCLQSVETVVSFAKAWNIPLMTTFKAKGFIPDSHPLACGVLGLSGTPMAMRTMRNADLLLVLGAAFAPHTRIAEDIPAIQVDLDPAALGKFRPVTLPVWGDIQITMEELGKALSAAVPKENPRPELAEQWEKWRETKANRASKDQGKGISSAAVFEAMSRRTPANAVIALDVGDNTYSFGRYFESKHQRVLLSGMLGSIGSGYPAAMGACCAAPDRPVVAVTGDGGFGQYLGELTTAVKYRMPIKHVLLNNSRLGKIAKEQKADKKTVWSTSLRNPDFAKYAEICGARGIRVESAYNLDGALEQAFAYNGPALVEVLTDPDLV